MLPGPVFNVELITTARRSRYYAIRFLYGMLLLFFIWQNDPSHYTWNAATVTSIQRMAAFGKAVFGTTIMVQSIAVLLLAPALVAGVIAEEKQRKTLHYLLSSRLSSGEIVVGKLMARLLHIGVLLMIGLPIMSLLSLVGGIDPDLVLIAYAATITTTFFLASMAILISTLSRGPRDAISLMYVVELVWLIVPPLLGALMPRGGGFWLGVYNVLQPVNDWIAPTSPLTLLMTVNTTSTGRIWDHLGWMMGLQLAFSALFVLVAVVLLRPVFRRMGESPRWLGAVGRGRRFLPRPECGDDAMLWKERFVSRTNATTKIVLAVLGLVVGGLLAHGVYQFAAPAFREVWDYGYGSTGGSFARTQFNWFLRVILTLIYMALALGIASAAASAVVYEREADTWTSLIATPLTGLEIIRAKLIGAVWGLRGLVLLFLTLGLIGVAAGALHPIAFMAAVVETVVFLAFAAGLGMFFSVPAKSTARAMALTALVLIVVNGGYTMCCIPLQANSPLIALGVTPAILPITLLSYDDFRALWSPPNRFFHADEWFVTCVLGTSAYAAAAISLLIVTINQFDDWIDRPRESWRKILAFPGQKPEPDDPVS